MRKRLAALVVMSMLIVGMLAIGAQASPPDCAVTGKQYAQGHIVNGMKGQGWEGLGHKPGVLHKGLSGFPGCNAIN